MEKQITLVNIIEFTKAKLPEYFSTARVIDDSNSPYHFYGEFMKFVMPKIVIDEDYIVLDKLIEFSNELFSSEDVDDDVKNLIGIEVFENLVNEKIAEYTKPKLSSSALSAFELAMRYSGYKDGSL